MSVRGRYGGHRNFFRNAQEPGAHRGRIFEAISGTLERASDRKPLALVRGENRKDISVCHIIAAKNWTAATERFASHQRPNCRALIGAEIARLQNFLPRTILILAAAKASA